MRAAITRRQAALGVAVLGFIGVWGCFRGNSLVDPGGPSGYRPPDPHVALITLAPQTVNGAAGSHIQISASPQNDSGKAVSANAVAWMSSNPAAATVSGTGLVTLVQRGSATITAIADGVTASVGAVVDPPPPESISVTPASAEIEAGQQAQLTATVFDATGAVDSGVAVSWSSSSSGVATVSTAGIVSAVAVGTATITASVGGVKGEATVQIASSDPVVASVTVSPGSSSLYPGGTVRLSASAKDASGKVIGGIPITWSTSNSAVAGVSSSGLVTANGVGSATITAAGGGQSGTASITVSAPVAASVTVTPSTTTMAPGQTTQLTATARNASGTVISVAISWSSTSAGVASVSSSGLVTANTAGSASITATAGSVSSSAQITVQAGPSGGYHEPSGMAVQINTGPMSSIPSQFAQFSPSTPSSTGEWRGNLTTVPGGTGLRVSYPTNVAGGNSPVRFGQSINSAGTGWYYQRMKFRFSPNWTFAGNVDVKICEPRTQQTGPGAGPNENHVVDAAPTTNPSQAFLQVSLQGPNGHFANLNAQPASAPLGNLVDGAWHLIEWVFIPESTPGAGNGGYQAWIDGTQVANYNTVLWLAPGNNVGWPYLMFDPTYGGGYNHPPFTIYWDFDELYVSTK